MSTSIHLAKHFREIYFGGNWSSVHYKQTLSTVPWEKAIDIPIDKNSIALLTFHATYYTTALLKVLQGGPLDAKDEYSFLLPEITSPQDWENLLNKCWEEAEATAILIANLSEETLQSTFVDEKYGTYLRNILGTIEHLHYHLGQITVLKKILAID